MAFLDDFTPTTVSPDNRHLNLCIDDEDEIVVGGTTTHIFTLPFKYSTEISSCEITYKQGLTSILTKAGTDCTKTETATSTTLTLVLSPTETNLFKPYSALDTFVQIKLKKTTGDIIYGEPNKITIKATIAKAGDEEDTYVEASMSDLVKLV